MSADAHGAAGPGGLHWTCDRLDALAPRTLHALMQARQAVFVVEQQCIYLDADDADPHCWHLAGWDEAGRLLAYARIVDPGIKYVEASIGRVLTTAAGRGRGLGHLLMQQALRQALAAYPGLGVRISAQSRLERFYAGLGFVVVGERYLEDGIPHTEMLRLPGGADAAAVTRPPGG